nr:MAG TPA: hypothetical protein [Caudoviricetes sp.]
MSYLFCNFFRSFTIYFHIMLRICRFHIFSLDFSKGRTISYKNLHI